jgi:hypothetical protein
MAQINKSTDHFSANIYSGNGSSTRSITGFGHQPDWLYMRTRNQAYSAGWQMYHSIRGVGSDQPLNTEDNYVAGGGNEEVFGYVTSYDSDGISVSVGSSDSDYVNLSGNDYVAFSWKMNGSTPTTNNDGSVTSNVSANQTAGQSIFTYAGGQSGNFTLGHGLSQAPEILITKTYDTTAQEWGTYYSVNGVNTNYNTLNSNNPQGTNNNTADGLAGNVFAILNTSTVTISDAAFANTSGNIIAMAMHSVPSYSKVGVYTGNGNSTNGPFIFCDFSPAFVMIKDLTTGGAGHSWCIFDNARATYNPNQKLLLPDADDSEYTVTGIDFLSNGFRINDSNQSRNDAGSKYLYYAVAAYPMVGTNNVVGTGK